MLTNQAVLTFIKAEPFRPFRIHMASGRTHDIRHPEMIRLLKTYAIVFDNASESDEFPDRSETISLMLSKSISFIEPSTVENSAS
jgi:hypothetical protein